jgi:urease accessory protein
MSGVVLPFDSALAVAPAPAPTRACASDGAASAGLPGKLMGRVRVSGGVRAVFAAAPAGTAIATLGERDGYRMRCPRTTTGCEGVIINTGGGLAGGDDVAFDITAGPAADVLVSTPSAERVYRALDPLTTRLDITLEACNHARLLWLPQETILFDGARLRRTLTADIAPDARFLAAEITVFGRKAHGEAMRTGLLSDTWRIRRDGILLFADNVRLEGEIASILARRAVCGGAHATAAVAYVAPDAGEQLDAVREVLATQSDCRLAASAWNGMLVMRGVSSRVEALRRAVATVATRLSGRPVSRVW